MPKKDSRKYSDRRDYLIQAVRKRRKKIKDMAITHKGGRCQICGYDRCHDALEFHHLDPAKKDFGVSDKGYSRSWNKVSQEIEKCILICSNCHKELHAGLIQEGAFLSLAGRNGGTDRTSEKRPHLLT